MRNLSIICLLFSVAIFTSCKRNVLRGSGNKTTVNPAVASFNAVKTELPLKLEITVQPGTQPAIQMSGYENVLNHIKVKIEENALVIYTDLDEMWTIDGDGISVQVTAPTLAGLTLSGAPRAGIHGNVTGTSLYIDISGAGTITLDSVNTDTLALDASGAADLRVNGGSVKYAEYEIRGAGEVKAFALQTVETKISISGAGDAQIMVLHKLGAHISGAGTIKYKGRPEIVEDVSEAGSIKDAN